MTKLTLVVVITLGDGCVVGATLVVGAALLGWVVGAADDAGGAADEAGGAAEEAGGSTVVGAAEDAGGVVGAADEAGGEGEGEGSGQISRYEVQLIHAFWQEEKEAYLLWELQRGRRKKVREQSWVQQKVQERLKIRLVV